MPIKNILVVDDSPTDRQQLSDILAGRVPAAGAD
jgi:CheY-like chemotaxis protein